MCDLYLGQVRRPNGCGVVRMWPVILAAMVPLAGTAYPDTSPVQIGSACPKTGVPPWDARGLGQLPGQGISCVDLSEDGRFVAVGTIAPPGDPNVFLLDADGRIVQHHEAGRRWINEVTVSQDGRFLTAVCTTPEGTAGDRPRIYAFLEGRAIDRIPPATSLRGLGSDVLLFHYGAHSNHVSRMTGRAAGQWVVAANERISWFVPGAAARGQTRQSTHLGPGPITAFAVDTRGRAVLGRLVPHTPGRRQRPCAVVVDPGARKPAWEVRPSDRVATPPKPEPGVYGPATPPYKDAQIVGSLSVAIDPSGKWIAAADYLGWRRSLRFSDGRGDVPLGRRFMPSRPAVRVFDSRGTVVCHLKPEGFDRPFWCDLAFANRGRELLIFPHNWTSRGLGGQPVLPADAGARDLYVLRIETNELARLRLPDAIAGVDTGGGLTAVGCWNGRVYLLDDRFRPLSNAKDGMDVGAASLVKVAPDGSRILVAATNGVIRMLDRSGKPLWRVDLNQAAPRGRKPWTRDQKAGKVGPGIWCTNGGLAHSDMGAQYLVEAPEGLLLIDPNSGMSFEQNWAKIKGAGLDPMRVKYVLLTHEHGDHAPGAYLWRIATGARVVAGAETAYVLQHHIPRATGYGFHPPVPVDIALTEDKELDLAGLTVRALRLPGHTYGSTGYTFHKRGRTFVAIGDLIMPGGVLGYSGSSDFSASDVLASLRKLRALGPQEILAGHGGGGPEDFIAKGIEAGEATGWGKMRPAKPDPLYRFKRRNYLVVAWLAAILTAAYGDIDADGWPDVAVVTQEPTGPLLKIYLNRRGRFRQGPDLQVALDGLETAWKLRIVHLNDDKVADFVVSSESRATAVISEDSKPRFRVVPLGHVPRATQFLPGDFNADGRMDVLIGSRFAAGHVVAMCGGDGSFRLRRAKTPSQPYFDMQLIDVNGDGRKDLVSSSGDVLLRRPDGSLPDAPTVRLSRPEGKPAHWTFLAAADFDNNAKTDIALLANGDDGAILWLFKNTGDPKAPFRPEPTAKLTARAAAVLRDGPTIADWNADGRVDLILRSRRTRSAFIVPGHPGRGLDVANAVTVPLDYEPHYDTRLGVADFNRDGRADLAGFGVSAVGAAGVYIQLRP